MAGTHHARSAPSSVPSQAGGLFAPLRPSRSLTESLKQRLAAEIQSGLLPPGAKLPTEQQLVAALGVSRTVVREAMAALRGDGLVIARQGAGVFVAPPDERRPFRIAPEALASLTSVLALMELRTGIEGEAAALAAGRRTQAELRRLDAAMTALDEAAAEGGDGRLADQDFHRAIMQATHNPFYRDIATYLGQVMGERQSVRAMAVPPPERGAYLRRVYGEHERIRDAIAARDETAAREAAVRHLRRSQARYGKLRERLEEQTRRS